VCDEARQGALRFRLQADGPYLAPSGPHAVPPLVDLPQLLGSSERVTSGDADTEDLRLLLAKFPRNSDEIDVVRWEAVALKLAQRAGIPVPPHRLELVAGRTVLLLSRFDRRGAERVPFLSAMSMLGAVDNEPRSYLEIADALRLYGAKPREDLEQLWRRIVFEVLINNTDDHLRNHGFLYQNASGWVLSPAYDLNPMPVDLAPRALTTAIDLDDPTASLELVLSTAGDYGINKERGVAVIQEVVVALEGWAAVAKSCGLNNNQIERMRIGLVDRSDRADNIAGSGGRFGTFKPLPRTLPAARSHLGLVWRCVRRGRAGVGAGQDCTELGVELVETLVELP
jgi:serine/threonine-protein kinase HipA